MLTLTLTRELFAIVFGMTYELAAHNYTLFFDELLYGNCFRFNEYPVNSTEQDHVADAIELHANALCQKLACIIPAETIALTLTREDLEILYTLFCDINHEYVTMDVYSAWNVTGIDTNEEETPVDHYVEELNEMIRTLHAEHVTL